MCLDFDPVSVEDRIIQAANLFLRSHAYLLICDVNERSITHKFAEQLQRDFPEWDVDYQMQPRSSRSKATGPATTT
jgi:hypothetical protein